MPAPDRLTRLRFAGLAASTLMAVGAYGAGALPAGDADAATLFDGPPAGSAGYWLGLVGWLVGLAALAGTWWQLGVRLGVQTVPGTGAVPLGWALRTGLLWAVPLLLAPPTGSRDVYAYACQGALWLDGVDPYTVGVLPGGCVWSDAVPALWQDTTTPYGPLAVALSGGVVALARLGTDSTDAQLLVAVALLRAVALVGVALVAGCLPRLARAGGVDPVRATWLGLLSPLIMIHAVSGAHNDALMLGLILVALTLPATASRGGVFPVAASRGGMLPVVAASRGGVLPVVAAGAVLGLAVAIKVTAIVALPFAVLLAATGSGPPGVRRPAPRHLVLLTGGALGGGALTFAVLTLSTGLDLGWIGGLSGTGRLVQWTSLPTGLGMAAGYVLRLAGRPEAVDPAVTVARLLGLALLAATIVVLLVRGWRAVPAPDQLARRRLVLAAGLAFSALAVLSPIFYPWYALAAVTVLAAGLPGGPWTYRVAGILVLVSFLVLPDGLGLAVSTKLPGALFDVALVSVLTVVAYRRWRPGGGRRQADRPEPP
ncbi:polyprenol phosphomannose-dependent alpha 1,6 mannosyltransferase MptB [Plantactinospora solaniradicis]|uniref:Polyprenol phosphomannose-dependent alpha 1,6 mannosyltransferase MptB n=1 Tax=Plantactinospora solaniradicis TaxID=1723736 RepID=A0ABW1KFB3_9ACTN